MELLRAYSNIEMDVDLPKLLKRLADNPRPEPDVWLNAVEPVRLTTELRARVVALYEAGKLAREIGAEFEISKSTVLKVLHQEGVAMRPGGPGRRPADGPA